MTRSAFFILLLLVLCGPQARADEVPGEPSSEAAAAEAARLEVGVITGDRVNVRVGPRIDNHAVTQLAAGEVVLVLEKRDGGADRIDIDVNDGRGHR